MCVRSFTRFLETKIKEYLIVNKIILSIDLKSLAIGFLLAIALGVAFSGFWQSKAANENVIVADEKGVYIMRAGNVRYIDKNKCRQGCHFNTQ